MKCLLVIDDVNLKVESVKSTEGGRHWVPTPMPRLYRKFEDSHEWEQLLGGSWEPSEPPEAMKKGKQ